jgi:DNA replication protein DnaC
MNIEALQQGLKNLRLGGMARTLPTRYQEARSHELDYLEFLTGLLDDETARRQDNLLNRRLKAARFPAMKTVDTFDFEFNTGIKKKDILVLANSSFVFKAQNILFIGPPGVGKSHLAIAIGIAAIHNGYSVLYKNAFDLVQEMADAEREDARKEYVRMMTSKVGLLIIDELGMKQMPKNAADDLLEIIHRRYQNSATIIATNRIVSDWGAILGDNAATAAILDRFLDDATIISIKGKSYRLTKNKQKEVKNLIL